MGLFLSPYHYQNNQVVVNKSAVNTHFKNILRVYRFPDFYTL